MPVRLVPCWREHSARAKKIARVGGDSPLRIYSYNTLKEKNVSGDSPLKNHNFYEKRNFYILQRLGKCP